MDEILFKITETARMVGVSPSTLRLWEAQGLCGPLRSPSGQRHYDRPLIERLKSIAWLRSEKGLNAAAIRERLAGRVAPEATGPQDPRSDGHEGDGVGIGIGHKVRRLRREADSTLDAVSQATGVSISRLSTFERTSQGLSLMALHEVAKHFGTTVAALSGQGEYVGESLVRDGQWKALPATSSGVTMQILAEGRTQMECHRFELAKGASSEGPYQHAGEEFLHVLTGSLEIVLDDTRFLELEPGDSFYFNSERPHSWRNSFDGETIIIWINTPPTF
ncbi:MAG TPA: MerR family transcriptional regulator [Roseiarcus sp.]|nr:MerR family transcriptional regulator [Roseiarcus sp.]